MAAAAADAENLKKVNPPFNPFLYSPNHSFLYIYMIKNDEFIFSCCSCSCWMRKSAQKLCFLREFLRFGFSAQKFHFLREYLPFWENLPKSSVSLENICPFCLSAQMFCFLTEYLPYWIICPISDYLPKIQKSAVLSCGCYSCCCRKLEKCKTPF